MKTSRPSLHLVILTLLAVGSCGFLAGCNRAADAVAAAPAGSSLDGELPVLGAAPEWQLARLDGSTFNSTELAGKVAVVDFWATWCGPCVREIPGYVDLQKKYAEQGLVFIGISVDDIAAAKVQAFAERYGVNYPILRYNNAIISAFGGVEAIPTTFLIDREGNIRHRKVGAMETEDYEPLIASLL